jgi:hypothetical protein
MRNDDIEWRAFRRRVAAGVLSFVLGFVALLATAIYLLAVYLQPSRGWFETIVFLLQLLPFILAGAGAISVGAMYVVDLPHLIRGDLHCPGCGRVNRRFFSPCPCWVQLAPARRPRHWVHYRRRIQPVLLAYLPILAVVLIFLGTRTSPRREPFLLDVAIGHAVLCALVGVMIHLTDSILEALHLARRWRLRARVFLRVFALWPFGFAVLMAIVKSLE